MKSKAVSIIGILAVVFLIYFVGSGFMKDSSVYIEDYSVSADGTEITIHTGVASSAGYVRKASINQQYGGKLYLDFYSAFGGINGSIDAENVHTLPLNEETNIIGIYRDSDCYEEVLAKDENGLWQRIK